MTEQQWCVLGAGAGGLASRPPKGTLGCEIPAARGLIGTATSWNRTEREAVSASEPLAVPVGGAQWGRGGADR